ncbi:hypothetical protein [Alteraurantiacibacter aquimixticola]|uniref:Uncharacterized protein n=1 Tax=Alteraurantiacibacter aquimixticola TaxID=2489173 RepID=A0A4T3EXA1_9SPHN|nr:hypothetical protein [Alteraurantiacibacter aquimixticola]TIX49206.1 hypothetical protein E5222_15960 [Alteraurantiacibacter aquimixticola]
MKTTALLAAGAALLTMTAAPVQAQDGPRVFERDGSWTLDAGEDSCRLARSFSDGESSVALALERNRLGNGARLILVGEALRTFRTAEQIGYRYLPASEAHDQRTAMFIRSETPDGQTYLNLGTILLGPNPFTAPPAMVPGREEGAMVLAPYDRTAEGEFAAGVTGIALNEGMLQPLRIETGSLGGAVEALQACTDDLLLSWGLDWEAHRGMSAPVEPIGPAYEWIPGNAVGFGDFAAFGGSRNPFRVMVDAEGKPTSCHVHWPSLSDSKNEAICKGIMENGRFHPALDANGQPMASYWMVDYFLGLARPFGR